MTDQIVTRRNVKRTLSLGLAGLGLVLLAACADSGTADPAAASQQRQDQLLANPMSAPQMGDPDITGGSIGDYRDQSMKRDLDDVLN